MVAQLSLERPEWETKGKKNKSPATRSVPIFPGVALKAGEE